MDHIRLIGAIALSFLVFLLWDYFFVSKKKVEQPKQVQQVEQQKKEEQDLEKKEKDIVAEKLMPNQVPVQPSRPAKTVTVNLPLYSLKISENGAVFESIILKNYREKIDTDSPFLEMISSDLPNGTLRIGLVDNSLPGLKDGVFNADLGTESVDILDKPQEVSFSWTSQEGVVVVKTFLFSPDSYEIGLTITIKNDSNLTIKDNLTLSLVKSFVETKSRFGFEGPSALINNDLEQIKLKKIKENNVYTGLIKWISVQDRYFMSAIIPEEAVEASMKLYNTENHILQNEYVQPVTVINPGTFQTYKYRLFFGPKSMKVLKEIGFDLGRSVNFGMFDFLAKPFVWIMDFLYDHFISNYGVAIIILTILTKIILWPLGNKSYKSMNEMKKIQPLVAEIREKYKDDKKKMNEEMMGLYKTYKVNPAGGCLPMVVQIPVFFALYRMLYEAIELRHAPFFLWINDLSAPDRLLRFDFSIPFMQPPYGIPVLTIIMGATMFVQQKMSPPMGDPTQAKMMMFMPIVFTFVFINFSSGLVLYWLINNVLSIAQQYYISKKKA
jgi:YidC/Oxa1 family membrane protein insertase